MPSPERFPTRRAQKPHRGRDGSLRIFILDDPVCLLEEPELSLHPEVVRYLPQMFVRVQRQTQRQVFISTHSPELLQDAGIGIDEVFLLLPDSEGTVVRPASSFFEIVDLLEIGMSMADAVIPPTRPENAEQLTFLDAL